VFLDGRCWLPPGDGIFCGDAARTMLLRGTWTGGMGCGLRTPTFGGKPGLCGPFPRRIPTGAGLFLPVIYFALPPHLTCPPPATTLRPTHRYSLQFGPDGGGGIPGGARTDTVARRKFTATPPFPTFPHLHCRCACPHSTLPGGDAIPVLDGGTTVHYLACTTTVAAPPGRVDVCRTTANLPTNSRLTFTCHHLRRR